MARINIRAYDGSLLGHFDDDATVEEVVEGKRWNGNNHVGVMSGLQIGYAEVIRTKGGRWVHHRDARNEYNGGEQYEFMTDDEARQWLMQAGTDEAERVLVKYFGEPEEEAGPNVGGRPEIGPAISVKYPQGLLDRIEAVRGATSRAQWLREAAEERLARLLAVGATVTVPDYSAPEDWPREGEIVEHNGETVVVELSNGSRQELPAGEVTVVAAN